MVARGDVCKADRLRAWVALGALLGCGPSLGQPAAVASTGQTSTGQGGGSTTGAGTTALATTTGVADTAGAEGVFLGFPDHSDAYPCDPWAQDCPPGQKCTYFSTDGGPSPNSARCVPIVDNPNGPDEPCTLDLPTGEDNCELGTACWFVDEDGVGRCTPVCKGSPGRPFCDDPNRACLLSSDGVLNLCMPRCHPLASDCFPDELCVPLQDNFICAFDADPDNALGPGDTCGFVNICDPGAFCGSAASNPLCDPAARGCCIPFCDLMAPDCAGTQCVPWFDPPAPAGLGNVGACVLPE